MMPLSATTAIRLIQNRRGTHCYIIVCYGAVACVFQPGDSHLAVLNLDKIYTRRGGKGGFGWDRRQRGKRRDPKMRPGQIRLMAVEFLYCGYRDWAKASPDNMSMAKASKMKAVWGCAEGAGPGRSQRRKNLSSQKGFISLDVPPLKNIPPFTHMLC